MWVLIWDIWNFVTQIFESMWLLWNFSFEILGFNISVKGMATTSLLILFAARMIKKFVPLT